MSPDAVHFSEVKEFVVRQRKLGRYKVDTAKNLETACGVIATLIEPGQDTIAYVSSHLDELFQRYSNLNPRIGQASIASYKARVARAIRDYLGHRTDPQWQPVARARRTIERGETENPPATQAPSPQPSLASVPPPPQPSAIREEANALRHRLPLRSDFDVEMLLPRDFTSKEAKRVTAWITALAGILDPEEPSA